MSIAPRRIFLILSFVDELTGGRCERTVQRYYVADAEESVERGLVDAGRKVGGILARYANTSIPKSCARRATLL